MVEKNTGVMRVLSDATGHLRVLQRLPLEMRAET